VLTTAIVLILFNLGGCARHDSQSPVVVANNRLISSESQKVRRITVGDEQGRIREISRNCSGGGSVTIGVPFETIHWVPAPAKAGTALNDVETGLAALGYQPTAPPADADPEPDPTSRGSWLRRKVGDQYLEATVTQWLPGTPWYRGKRPNEVTVELDVRPNSGC
jgi:hypothetical protein